MPDVSVVIPAYNAQATLAETLQSVISQTLSDFEVIVVDDGSTDMTAAIACSFGDPRIRVISMDNGGVARARNRGVAESHADLIAFLDADDVWQPHKLQRQVQRLEEAPHIAVCVTAATQIDTESRELGSMPLLQADDCCEALLLYSMIAGCISSGLIRKGALDQVGGFNPTFTQCADWDLWLRLSRITRFAMINEELVLYRTHSGNMSHNLELLERDTFAVLGEFFGNPNSAPYAASRRRIYSNHWMICAGSYLHAGRPRDAMRCVAHGLLMDPGNARRALPSRWLAQKLDPAGRQP